MPRRKSPVAEHIATAQLAEVVAVAAQPAATPPEALPEPSFDPAELEKPAPPKARSHGRAVIGYHFADGASIAMIDTGSRIGVHFDLPGGGKPPAELLDVVREERTYGQTVRKGLTYEAREKSWMKRVGDNPVMERLDCEARTKDAADKYLASKNLDGPARG